MFWSSKKDTILEFSIHPNNPSLGVFKIADAETLDVKMTCSGTREQLIQMSVELKKLALQLPAHPQKQVTNK